MKGPSFEQHYKIIYDKFIECFSSDEFTRTTSGFVRFLGHTHDGKVRAWRKGQWPSSGDCGQISEKMGFSLRWLLAGEGDPYGQKSSKDVDAGRSTPADAPVPRMDAPIPLVGFASCGIQGWGGTMTFDIPVTPPHARPDMIAVMASGESMLPEGIGNGHICFCDPHAMPMAGECVYVETLNKRGSLKKYIGDGVRKDGKRTVKLHGWMKKEIGKESKSFEVEIERDFIKTLAPVIYIQRRM